MVLASQKTSSTRSISLKNQEYNEMALQNYKTYEETKLKLRLEADVDKKNFNVWMTELRKNNEAVCWKNAIESFQLVSRVTLL